MDVRRLEKLLWLQTPNYILKMSDVQAVRVRARLVVLSCCHSGRGEVKAEGVVGMARAFLYAGARSVLMSLWAIDDEATLLFMKRLELPSPSRWRKRRYSCTSSHKISSRVTAVRCREALGSICADW